MPLPQVQHARPRLAVWKFASCDGCQLSLLDCEDELLAIFDLVQIVNFAEFSKSEDLGPYDISLIDGSITTEADIRRILEIRAKSTLLITLGACATAGGIQALRNFAKIEDYLQIVYASPEYISTLATSTPISSHVKVDFELRGCPINKHQLLEVLISLVQGEKTGNSLKQRLHGMQMEGKHVRHGSLRHPLSWACDPCRLRCALPHL